MGGRKGTNKMAELYSSQVPLPVQYLLAKRESRTIFADDAENKVAQWFEVLVIKITSTEGDPRCI